MEHLDAGLKIAGALVPPAVRYIGKAKEREAKLVETQDELAQSKAQVEVLTVRNYDTSQQLKQSEARAAALSHENQELSFSVANLEAFRNIVLVLLVAIGIVYVGMVLTSESA